MAESCPIVTYPESAMDLKDRYPQNFPVNVRSFLIVWVCRVVHCSTLFVSANELLSPYQSFDYASIGLGPFHTSLSVFLDQPKPAVNPQMTMPSLLFRPFNFCEPWNSTGEGFWSSVILYFYDWLGLNALVDRKSPAQLQTKLSFSFRCCPQQIRDPQSMGEIKLCVYFVVNLNHEMFQVHPTWAHVYTTPVRAMPICHQYCFLIVKWSDFLSSIVLHDDQGALHQTRQN